MEKKTKQQFLKQEAESFPESKQETEMKKKDSPDQRLIRVLGHSQNDQVTISEDESNGHESVHHTKSYAAQPMQVELICNILQWSSSNLSIDFRVFVMV